MSDVQGDDVTGNEVPGVEVASGASSEGEVDTGEVGSAWTRVWPRRRATAWATAPSRREAFAGARFAVSRAVSEISVPFGPLQSDQLYRFVMGVDREPVVMPAGQASTLKDPFATTFLLANKFPATLVEIIEELDAAKVVPVQSVFLISEATPPGDRHSR